MGKVKLEIFGGEDVVKDSIIRLRLVNRFGSVCVAAVDGNGNPIDHGHIAGFRVDNGELVMFRYTDPSSRIPMRKNAFGGIKLAEEV